MLFGKKKKIVEEETAIDNLKKRVINLEAEQERIKSHIISLRGFINKRISGGDLPDEKIKSVDGLDGLRRG